MRLDGSGAQATGGGGDTVVFGGARFNGGVGSVRRGREQALGRGGHHGVPVQDMPVLQQA